METSRKSSHPLWCSFVVKFKIDLLEWLFLRVFNYSVSLAVINMLSVQWAMCWDMHIIESPFYDVIIKVGEEDLCGIAHRDTVFLLKKSWPS